MMVVRKKDAAFYIALVVATNALTLIGVLYAVRHRDPAQPIAESAAKLDTLLTLMLADTVVPAAVPESLSPAVRSVVASMQTDHRRISGQITASTTQRNRQMDRIEDLAELAACNSGDNRYAFCRRASTEGVNLGGVSK